MMRASRQSMEPKSGVSQATDTHSTRHSLMPASVPRLQKENGQISRDPKIKGPDPVINFGEATRLGNPDVLGDGYESDLEVYKFMIETEQDETRPSPHLFDHQSNITPRMRSTVIDWLVEIHRRFKMHSESLYMTIYLLDMYLTECDLDKACYQRLACAALMIAAKSEERSVPLMEDFVYVAGKSFSATALQRMEASLFEKVGCHVTPILAFSFLSRSLRFIQATPQQSQYCLFILESLLLDSDFIGVRPSFLAAAVFYTGFKIMNKDDFQWDVTMTKNIGYDEPALKPVANHILRALSVIAKGPYKATRKKYTTETMGDLSLVEFPERFD